MRLNKWLVPMREFSKCMGGGSSQDFRGVRTAIAGVMVLVLASQSAVAQAAPITVNSPADPGAPGICALRDAIEAANTETAVNGCSAGDGNDTIQIIMSGVIQLGDSLPEVTGNLTIAGPIGSSAGVTVDGGGAVQVMHVGSGATLNLSYMTIANGFALSGRGGGILNNGILTVSNSTLLGNSTGEGGGIYNSGELTVTNSTFTGNIGGVGGAIYNAGTATISNSTYSGNQAKGGFCKVVGDFVYCFAVGIPVGYTLGGGIFNVGPTTLKGSILAGNKGKNCGIGANDAGYNISDDGSCGFTGTAANGQAIGDNVDPELDTAGLQNNGGPTETIALMTGSPAIDAIPSASCTDQPSPPQQLTIDQRGLPRPDPEDGSQPACDIGAVETQEPVQFTHFRAAADIDLPDSLLILGTFVRAANGTAINPATQALILTLSSESFGPVTLTIPPGSFKKILGQYVFVGTLDGVKVAALITSPHKNIYGFTIAEDGLDLVGITSPVALTLQLGSNIGTSNAKAVIH
jgi:hypothetical protein